MFIALARFPQVPADRDADFQSWFTWSSQRLVATDGLLNRRLLRTPDGSYAALVEHETAASFAAMHSAQVHKEIQSRLRETLPEAPQATTFEVLLEAQTRGCCGGGHRHEQPDQATGGSASGETSCCHAG